MRLLCLCMPRLLRFILEFTCRLSLWRAGSTPVPNAKYQQPRILGTQGLKVSKLTWLPKPKSAQGEPGERHPLYGNWLADMQEKLPEMHGAARDARAVLRRQPSGRHAKTVGRHAGLAARDAKTNRFTVLYYLRFTIPETWIFCIAGHQP